MNNSQFGIIQGRIFPEDKLRYNIFPSNWRHELILSKRIGYKYIEFLLDDKLSRKNPLVNKKISSLKKSMIKSKQKVYSVILTYFVNHNFFKNYNKSIKILKRLIIDCQKLNINLIVIPLVENGSLNKKKLLFFLKEIYKIVKNKKIRFSIELDSKLNLKSKLNIFIKYCPKIGICYDTGNSISENKDFVKEISYLSRVINHIHLKDKIKKGKKFYNTYLGNGLLDFYKLKVTLNRINYKKKITLECFYGNNPIQDSVKNLEFARKNLIYEQ